MITPMSPVRARDADDLRETVFTALEALARSLDARADRAEDHVVLQLHRHPLVVRADPLPDQDGATRLSVTCTIRLARDVASDRYLPLLARHARRNDPLALLVQEAGELSSVRHHRIRSGPDLADDVRHLVMALVVQAVQAEFLVNEATLDGLLIAANAVDDAAPGPDVIDRLRPETRPNRLLTYTHRVAEEGLRQMATTNLTGASKLGPWFVGTEQDELLEARMREGWLRTADAERHVVSVRAPADHPNLDEIRIRWAHASPLMGPCLHLAAVTRSPLGANPGRRLRSLNRPGDLAPYVARVGLWLPLAWLDPDALGRWSNGAWRSGALDEDDLADEPAVYVSIAPTAWARPGTLARTWLWAEAEVDRALGARTLN